MKPISLNHQLKKLCEIAKIYAYRKGYPNFRDDFSQHVALHFTTHEIPKSMEHNLWGLLPHRWVDFLRTYNIPRQAYKDPVYREFYRTAQLNEEMDATPIEDDTPIVRKEDIIDMYRYLDRFERLVFSLHYLMGYSLIEIADMAQYSGASLTLINKQILKRIETKTKSRSRRRRVNRDRKKKSPPAT